MGRSRGRYHMNQARPGRIAPARRVSNREPPMRRPAILLMILTSVLLLFAACSQDVVTPDQTDTIAETGQPDKRLVLPDLDGPMTLETYLFILDNSFDTINWVATDVVMPVWDGGTVSVLPQGYPAGHEVSITFTGNRMAPNEFETGTIWLPAPLPAGVFLDIPGNCLLYRTLNIPPAGIKTATVGLPIMAWNQTDNFTGDFTTYDLFPISENESEARNLESVTIAWPGTGNNYYVESTAFPDKDSISHAIDHVVDPDEPGEEE